MQSRHQRGEGQGAWPPQEKLAPLAGLWPGFFLMYHSPSKTLFAPLLARLWRRYWPDALFTQAMSFLHRPDALPVVQPTVSKHCGKARLKAEIDIGHQQNFSLTSTLCVFCGRCTQVCREVVTTRPVC